MPLLSCRKYHLCIRFNEEEVELSLTQKRARFSRDQVTSLPDHFNLLDATSAEWLASLLRESYRDSSIGETEFILPVTSTIHKTIIFPSYMHSKECRHEVEDNLATYFPGLEISNLFIRFVLVKVLENGSNEFLLIATRQALMDRIGDLLLRANLNHYRIIFESECKKISLLKRDKNLVIFSKSHLRRVILAVFFLFLINPYHSYFKASSNQSFFGSRTMGIILYQNKIYDIVTRDNHKTLLIEQPGAE